MNVLIAADSFKNALSAPDVCLHIKQGWERAMPEATCVCKPMADGGEGTMPILTQALGGRIVDALVVNPLGHPHRAAWGWIEEKKLAVIELAEAAGLECLKKEEYNPLNSTTYGVGQLMMAAIEAGAKDLLIALGGSATNDAGVGLLSALGAKFFDQAGELLPYGGAALSQLSRIDLSNLTPALSTVNIQVACDVNNPLYGPNGASAIFGPQKGASLVDVETLDSAIQHYANVCKDQFNYDLQNVIGGGAAGGVAASLCCFLNGKIVSGAQLVMEYSDIYPAIAHADIIITGEGCVDKQTREGKLPWVISKAAEKNNVPVIILSGTLGDDYESLYELENIKFISSITPYPVSLAAAIKNSAVNLEKTSFSLAKIFS